MTDCEGNRTKTLMMASIPVTPRQAIRVALVFAALIVGFGLLSTVTGWPDSQSWGLVVFLALLIAALPLLGPLLEFFRESGAVIDIRGVKLDFSASATRGVRIEAASIEPYPGVPVNDSSAASIAESSEAALSAAVVVVDLGTGKNWYPTRLFALAAAATELKGARAIVIVAQRAGVPESFVGWLRPQDVVTAFFQKDQRYTKALIEARAVLHHLRLSGGRHTYRFPTEYRDAAQKVRSAYGSQGDLAFVPALIAQLQSPQPAPANAASNEALEDVGQPVWIDFDEASKLFDPWLVREHISDEMNEAKKLEMLLTCDEEFLAHTGDKGKYVGIIDVPAAVRRSMLRLYNQTMKEKTSTVRSAGR